MNKLLLCLVLTLLILLVGCQRNCDKAEYAKGIVLEISENKIQVASKTDPSDNINHIVLNGNVWINLTERTGFGAGVSNEILVGNYVEIIVCEFHSGRMEGEATLFEVNIVPNG
ncbi:hypothetical protein RI065_05680 [Mycoplasmatota bacterium zrk1]